MGVRVSVFCVARVISPPVASGRLSLGGQTDRDRQTD